MSSQSKFCANYPKISLYYSTKFYPLNQAVIILTVCKQQCAYKDFPLTGLFVEKGVSYAEVEVHAFDPHPKKGSEKKIVDDHPDGTTRSNIRCPFHSYQEHNESEE